MDENYLSDFEKEIKDSLEEADQYSAASKEFTETVKNVVALDSAKLAREKFEAEREESKEKLKLERLKMQYEHEEKMERYQTERAAQRTELIKGVITGGFMIGGLLIALYYEQTRPIVTKTLSMIPKVNRIF